MYTIISTSILIFVMVLKFCMLFFVSLFIAYIFCYPFFKLFKINKNVFSKIKKIIFFVVLLKCLEFVLTKWIHYSYPLTSEPYFKKFFEQAFLIIVLIYIMKSIIRHKKQCRLTDR